MAAAGLHPGRASIDNNVVTVQKETQNLIHLIRFAMSMIKVLGRLNSMTRIRELTEQKKKSANFKLRIGIASGPVIAGGKFLFFFLPTFSFTISLFFLIFFL